VADGGAYDDADHEDYNQFVETAADLGLVETEFADAGGGAAVRFEHVENLPLSGPLAVRITDGEEVSEAFAVGLIEGAMTSGTTVSVMVVAIDTTSDAYFAWDAFGRRTYIP